MSRYPCLGIIGPGHRAEALSCALIDLGATAIEERDDTTMLTAETPGCVALFAAFNDDNARDAALLALGQTGENNIRVQRIDVTDDSWRSRWQAYFQPVVLDTLMVLTPWMTSTRSDRIPLIIDPGLAFGTGGHATTKTVLKMLEKRAGQPGMPARVLDVGTGSGVLAIAALKLGAQAATAVDIDPDAVQATRSNARLNGIQAHLTAYVGRARHTAATWPLVLANLELAVFEKDARDIAKRVAVGGTLILSGLLADQVPACLALWPGFALKEREDDEGWAALGLVRLP
ncbi:MAG: 50S ribosomal protein L11 methyltransferase [Myxococcota bacterium]|nr:50S ribosomal protein L11 methyltransferase [Myxococcota bacterium]